MLPFPHEEGKRLAEFCTFGIGGPAKFFAVARQISQLQEMIAYCNTAHLPFFILGKGSNLLFDDRGYNGLVILNRIDTLQHIENRFIVGAGYGFARLGSQTARAGYSGLEFASGIPATVGGALYMNAGANGCETFDALTSVVYISDSGEKIHYQKADLQWGYRKSSFQKWRGAIAEATFTLTPCPEAKKKQKQLLDYRLQTQPYGDKSAGCVFRNPEGNSAGRLIEECGWKGKLVGQAGVSEKHANFIVNAGGAKAREVLELIEEIKRKVFKERGILLEEEIRYISYE